MYKLLIVDDELTELKFLRFVVEKYDLPISICAEGTTGEEAIELAEKHHPDIIIMDIHMPIKDGLEAAAIIKDKYPKTKIYLLTAFEEFEYAKRAVKISVEDYLTKPISPQQLIEVLKKGIAKLLQEKINQNKTNRLNRQFEEIKPTLKRQLVYDLISYNVDHVRLKKILNLNKVAPNVVVVASLNDLNNQIVNSSTIIDTFAKDLDNKIGFGLYSIMSDQKLVVFCKNYKQKSVRTIIDKWSDKGYKIFLGLSSIKNDGDIVNAFDAANEAYKTAVFWNKSEIVTIKDIPKVDSYQLNPKILQQEILNLLLARKENDIEIIFENILINMEKNNYPSQQVINLIENISNLLFSNISSEIISIEEFNKIKTKFYNQLKKIHGKSELMKLLNELVNNLKEKMFDSGSSSAEKSVLLALEYIELNYHKDLNLEKVAGKLFLSSCYLSRIFKKNVGQGFATYLIKFRMEKAQQLLQTGKYSVAEVSEKVGYKDASYFSSVFKKHMKITPSETISLGK